MKKITLCPFCNLNALCSEVNDDEGIEEIDYSDAIFEKQKGAKIIECKECGGQFIIKKLIETEAKQQKEKKEKEIADKKKEKEIAVKEARKKAGLDLWWKKQHAKIQQSREKIKKDRESIIKKECKVIQSDALTTKFYNLSPLKNLESILEKGMLCHRLLEEDKNIQYENIANSEIMDNRKAKFIKYNKTLQDFANLYFNARNAMMYSVTRDDKTKENTSSEYAVIEIEIDIRKSHCDAPVIITDINAARKASIFYDAQWLSLETFEKIKDCALQDYFEGNKAETQAECLIENKVSPSYFKRIHVCCYETRDKVNLIQKRLPININRTMFFM